MKIVARTPLNFLGIRCLPNKISVSSIPNSSMKCIFSSPKKIAPLFESFTPDFRHLILLTLSQAFLLLQLVCGKEINLRKADLNVFYN
jgi:hypothetical protein